MNAETDRKSAMWTVNKMRRGDLVPPGKVEQQCPAHVSV